MKSASNPKTYLALASFVVALLAVTGIAGAHPSVYTSGARSAPSGFTYGGTGGTGLVTTPRYVVANHGYVKVFTESNGVSGTPGGGPSESTGGGVLDYKWMPSAYRTALKADSVNGGNKVFLAEANTGVQVHATCVGNSGDAAKLSQVTNILAWQEADPFYGYVPFQPQSAGLGDTPDEWVPLVDSLTGVDLSAVTDTSTDAGHPLATLCAGIGGTLVKPDTLQSAGSAFASADIADAVTAATGPLNSQITTLTTEKDTLAGDKVTLQSLVDSLTGSKSTLEADKAALTSSNAALTAQLATANKAKKKADSQIKSLKKQVAKLKKQLKKKS